MKQEQVDTKKRAVTKNQIFQQRDLEFPSLYNCEK